MIGFLFHDQNGNRESDFFFKFVIFCFLICDLEMSSSDHERVYGIKYKNEMVSCKLN